MAAIVLHQSRVVLVDVSIGFDPRVHHHGVARLTAVIVRERHCRGAA